MVVFFVAAPSDGIEVWKLSRNDRVIRVCRLSSIASGRGTSGASFPFENRFPMVNEVPFALWI